MNKSLHGHNVLNLVKEQAQPLSKIELLHAIGQAFGEEARFHTCSAKDLTAENLVELFMNKRKAG